MANKKNLLYMQRKQNILAHKSLFWIVLTITAIFLGFSVFVVGVADVDYNELANIASKPSERHVFIVDDFESFEKIEDNLITFVCETATSSKSWLT